MDLKRLDLSVIDSMRHGRNSSLTLADRSIDVYKIAGQQFNDFLGNNGKVVDENTIRAFFDSQKGWASTTANLKRQALMKLIQNQPGITESYIEMASIREMFARNVARAKQISQAITEGSYLTEFQVKRLIDNCSKRMALIVEFLFVTGCRISEMINIKVQDISKGKVYRIRILGKGSKQRIVFSEKGLMADIYDAFGGKTYLFESQGGNKLNRNNISKEMARFGVKAGLKRVHPHIFRHSCAMHLKKKGKTPDFIQKYLGHVDVATTLRFYFHHEPKAGTVRLFGLR